MSKIDLEHLSQYIFPILLVLFYLFSGGKKKKKPQHRPPVPEQREEREEVFAPPLPRRREPVPPLASQEAPKSLPPVQRKLSHLESAITERRLSDKIEGRHYQSAITNERAELLVSAELTEHIDLDEAYALKRRGKISRGRALLKQSSSLKDAFILQEIFKEYNG